MEGKIEKLRRYAGRGDEGELLEEMILTASEGIEGNYIQGGEKQVCLCTSEARNWMQEQTEKGLCFRRFNENILISGMDPEMLKLGTLIAAGDAVLKVTALKPCFDECILHSNNRYCMLSVSAKFLSVEKSGSIKADGTISILNP